MKTDSLGLKRGEVRLVPHNPLWKSAFIEESSRIIANLPELKLHHIGSTSIEGLSAKPILDIMGEVEKIIQADVMQPVLEQLGYEWKGEYGIRGRRYCVLYEGDTALVHLHILESDSAEFKNHLLFRERLNENLALRDEYDQLKKTLAEAGMSREAYTEAKAGFIQKVLTNKI